MEVGIEVQVGIERSGRSNKIIGEKKRKKEQSDIQRSANHDSPLSRSTLRPIFLFIPPPGTPNSSTPSYHLDAIPKKRDKFDTHDLLSSSRSINF